MTYYRKHQKKAINRKSVTPVEPADKNKIRNETFANDTWEDKGVVLKKFRTCCAWLSSVHQSSIFVYNFKQVVVSLGFYFYINTELCEPLAGG